MDHWRQNAIHLNDTTITLKLVTTYFTYIIRLRRKSVYWAKIWKWNIIEEESLNTKEKNQNSHISLPNICLQG